MASELTEESARIAPRGALLMISHYFEDRRGGIELVAAALARELASIGFGVSWAATGQQKMTENGDFRRVALSASHLVERFLKIPFPLLRVSGWRAIFREVKAADVIIAHDAIYLTSIAASLAARVHRKPILIVQHVGVVPYRSAVLRRLMKLANRLIAAPVLRGADRVAFVSELTMEHFQHLRWRRQPTLIFNGVDTGTFSPAASESEARAAREALGLPPFTPIALFVGRFTEKKGMNVLEKLVVLRPDFLFAFAGRGELDPRDWGLPNVRVYDALSGPSLAPLYRASDILVLPSVGEGFPLVVQEALACGVPVICGLDTARADARATPHLSGIRVALDRPERTAHAFSEEMTRVLGLPCARGSREVRAQFARAHYSWGAATMRYVELLRSLQFEGSHSR